jgi:hypothetical protein
MGDEVDPTTPEAGFVRLTIVPVSDYFSPEDPRAASETYELRQALQRDLPAELEVHASSDEKGILSSLILSLTSSGAITALVEVLKAWLGTRPVHRTLDVQFEYDEKKGKRTGTLHLDASNIDSDELAKIMSGAFGPES